MPNTTDNTSKITLKMYVEILRIASKGDLGHISKIEGKKARIVRELKNSGLLFDETFAPFDGAGVSDDLYLTPEGASALESWSTYLREGNPWYKLGTALIRFLWVIVGALAASLTDIFDIIFT